jgi:spore coat protein U-like protein
MRPLRIDIWLAAAAVAFLLPAEARASCAVSVSDVTFGRYDPALGAPNTGVGALSVACDKTSGVDSYRLVLSVGRGSSYANRRMNNNDATIVYQLYQDLAHSKVWGDGTGGSHLVRASGIAENGGMQVFFVYGQIPAGLKANAGSYADTVIMTIEY